MFFLYVVLVKCFDIRIDYRHSAPCILVSGKGSLSSVNANQYAITYHSTHENKVLRQFIGHTDVVNEIVMSPIDDTFLTSSRDRTVRYVR
jgi:WD40 repeat protein